MLTTPSARDDTTENQFELSFNYAILIRRVFRFFLKYTLQCHYNGIKIIKRFMNKTRTRITSPDTFAKIDQFKRLYDLELICVYFGVRHKRLHVRV